MEYIKLSVKEVEKIAFYLAKNLDWKEVIPDFNTRYPNILESCLETPFSSFEGKDLYPSIYNKASILFYLMNKNHPFRNGNKRLAVSTLLVFLFLNGYWITVKPEELYSIAIEVAESHMRQKDSILKKLNNLIELNCERLTTS